MACAPSRPDWNFEKVSLISICDVMFFITRSEYGAMPYSSSNYFYLFFTPISGRPNKPLEPTPPSGQSVIAGVLSMAVWLTGSVRGIKFHVRAAPIAAHEVNRSYAEADWEVQRSTGADHEDGFHASP